MNKSYSINRLGFIIIFSLIFSPLIKYSLTEMIYYPLYYLPGIILGVIIIVLLDL